MVNPLFALLFACLLVAGPNTDARLKGSFRKPTQDGWTLVHLQGSPANIGYQHGYLLFSEIASGVAVLKAETTHDTGKDWSFLREAAEKQLWPKVDPEYQAELQGIADGLHDRGVKLDLWDIVAANATLEIGYFVSWYDKQHGVQSELKQPERCSAFVATGSYTKDGKVVVGHNNWSSYASGERWTIIFDIVPEKGHQVVMDGYPGLIHSADDFGLNSAGIVITETTITAFSGWNPDGIPEFVRARKAMQYSSSIDDFYGIMTEGNNGGYANDWLIADLNKNEIASLELGLKNVNLQRTSDGYFCGANFPISEKLAKEETTFPVDDKGVSANARRARWQQLMAEHKGRIDVDAGKKFLSDHFDTFTGKTEANERTLCGHVDVSPRGLGSWQPAFGVAGAVTSKITDADMARKMSLWAAAGHACGADFKAAEHLKKHPEFDWQKSFLEDMKAYGWTEIRTQD